MKLSHFNKMMDSPSKELDLTLPPRQTRPRFCQCLTGGGALVLVGYFLCRCLLSSCWTTLDLHWNREGLDETVSVTVLFFEASMRYCRLNPNIPPTHVALQERVALILAIAFAVISFLYMACLYAALYVLDSVYGKGVNPLSDTLTSTARLE